MAKRVSEWTAPPVVFCDVVGGSTDSVAVSSTSSILTEQRSVLLTPKKACEVVISSTSPEMVVTTAVDLVVLGIELVDTALVVLGFFVGFIVVTAGGVPYNILYIFTY